MSNAVTPENCLIGIKNYGEYRVIITEITHGISIVASESQSRMGNAFYPTKRTSGSFDLSMVFRSHAEQERFCKWVEGYLRRKSNPDNNVGEMRVLVPRFNFDKTGLPAAESGIPYGDTVGNVLYPVRMTFVGTNDPLDVANVNVRSKFLASINPENDPALPYLTPSDTQLSGSDSGDDLLYNLPRDTDIRFLLGGAG